MSDDLLLPLYCGWCGLKFGSLVFSKETQQTITPNEVAQIVRTNQVQGICPPCEMKYAQKQTSEHFTNY